MKRVKEYAYGFDINEELTIYSRIGEEKSPYQNYCEWHGYICEKYGGGKYAESTLKNFVHYLKREKNLIMSRKEMWTPLVNVINTYNNSINMLIDEEFLEYTGYNPKLIYEALEQNLHSGMWFYIWGAFLMGLIVLMFLFFASVRIRSNNLKNEFYSDFITIVQEIIEEQKSGNAETA